MTQEIGKDHPYYMPSAEEHIYNILNLIHDEVRNSGGDGDAIWYTETILLEKILPVLTKFNLAKNNYWTITIESDCVTASNGQEYFVITDKEEVWNNRPSWQQMSLKI